MTSFTKQLRRGTGVFARENIEQAPEMTPAEVETTLAEPVAAEIEQEVVAPVAEIEAGNDALVEAEADASTLENTANIIEGAIGDTNPDVDVATSELANITVERIAAKYNLARGVKLSKEAYGTAENRTALAKSISKEAFEKAGELRKRVAEGIAKIIEWFKNLIKSVFDKRVKLEKRFQAIQATAKAKSAEGLEAAPDGKTITIGGNAYMKNGAVVDNVMELADPGDLKKLIDSFKLLSKSIEDTMDTKYGDIQDGQDFNPSEIGGVLMHGSPIGNGLVVVTKVHSGDNSPKDIKPMPVGWVMSASRTSLDVLKYLGTAEGEIKSMISSLDKIAKKNPASDNADENKKQQVIAMHRVKQAMNLSGWISGLVLMTLSSISTACEKSMATYEKPAA